MPSTATSVPHTQTQPVSPLPTLLAAALDAVDYAGLAVELMSDAKTYIDSLEMMLARLPDARPHGLAVLAQIFVNKAMTSLSNNNDLASLQFERVKAMADMGGANHV